MAMLVQETPQKRTEKDIHLDTPETSVEKKAKVAPANLLAHPGAAVYAASLDGLELKDPVTAFFDFCKARESVRQKREAGEAGPWSTDEIFQRGRFLNVFREDDRVTKALFRFLAPCRPSEEPLKMIQAVFFARWCNRDSTMDAINMDLLGDSSALREKLTAMKPWSNETAYPVESVSWEGKTYDRFEAASELFGRIAPWLLEQLKTSNGDVQKATDAINEVLGMKNDFPIFMAVMDVAWFRPDLIRADSPVPVGIGAVAFVNRLQTHLGLSSNDEVFQRMIELQPEYWPEAKRSFQPIDVEYLCCECRKYYSYVNGTKTFEGKNVFTPGKSPQI